MTTFLIYFILSVQFDQVAYFPYGSPGDFLYVSDCDHDGNYEFFCNPDTATYYFEHINANQYAITNVFGFVTIAVGNGDVDSLTDAFGNILHPFPGHSDTLAIYESRDYNSFPDSQVWVCMDTVAWCAANGIFIDFDQDDRMNLITNYGHTNRLYIYENLNDNEYVQRFKYVFSDFMYGEMTIFDFDYDGLLEIIYGDVDGRVHIFENTAIGVDSFHQTWSYQIPSGVNAWINAKGDDMDGDGRVEFVVGCRDYFGSSFTVFESNGNNSYEETWHLNYTTGGSLTYGDVDCGDVDGDGVEEMVTFGGLLLYVWKCVGPDSFIQFWEHDFHYDLVDGRLLVYDLNQNGYDEIVISGFNYDSTPPLKTYIFEYVPPGITEETSIEIQEAGLEVQPNPFRDGIAIRYCIGQSSSSGGLKIYDADGRLVKKFLLPTFPTSSSGMAGVNPSLSASVIWQGDDDSGRKLPAGIYFVQLENRNFSIVEKVIKLE